MIDVRDGVGEVRYRLICIKENGKWKRALCLFQFVMIRINKVRGNNLCSCNIYVFCTPSLDTVESITVELRIALYIPDMSSFFAIQI